MSPSILVYPCPTRYLGLESWAFGAATSPTVGVPGGKGRVCQYARVELPITRAPAKGARSSEAQYRAIVVRIRKILNFSL